MQVWPGVSAPASDATLDQLPESYRLALLLHAAGRSIEEIAAELDLDPSAVPSLLALGRAKVASLEATADSRCVPRRENA